MNKPTLVLGASPNPDRYSYQAALLLQRYGHDTYPVGIRKGKIGEMEILHDNPPIEGLDTVTLYLGPDVQQDYYDYILSLQPKRIIFNPGTENPAFFALLRQQYPEIDLEVACTLVMLRTGQY
jgi:predicted CoA-binding protein